MKKERRNSFNKLMLIVVQFFVFYYSFTQGIIELEGSRFVDFMNEGLEKNDFEKSTKVYVWQKKNSLNFIDSLSRQNIIVLNSKDKNIIHKTQYFGNLNSPNATDGVKVFKHVIKYSVNELDTVVNSLVLYDFKEEKILILECSIEVEIKISNVPLSAVYEDVYLDSLLLTGEEYDTIRTILNKSSSQLYSKKFVKNDQNIFLIGKVGSVRNRRYYKIYLLNQSKGKIEFYHGSIDV